MQYWHAACMHQHPSSPPALSPPPCSTLGSPSSARSTLPPPLFPQREPHRRLQWRSGGCAPRHRLGACEHSLWPAGFKTPPAPCAAACQKLKLGRACVPATSPNQTTPRHTASHVAGLGAGLGAQGKRLAAVCVPQRLAHRVAQVTPNQLRWRPFPVPHEPGVDFLRGTTTICGAGRWVGGGGGCSRRHGRWAVWKRPWCMLAGWQAWQARSSCGRWQATPVRLQQPRVALGPALGSQSHPTDVQPLLPGLPHPTHP